MMERPRRTPTTSGGSGGVGGRADASAYQPQQSRERIAAMQAQQQALQHQHHQQWAHTAAAPAQPMSAWRASPTASRDPQSASVYADALHPPPQQLQPRPPPPSQLAASSGRRIAQPPATSSLQPHSHSQTQSLHAFLSQPPAASSSSSRVPAVVHRPSTMATPREDRRQPITHDDSSPRTPRSQSQSQVLPELVASGGHHVHPLVPSLNQKVALALADLESIRSRNYRPSTAAAATSRDTALPRPRVSPANDSVSSDRASEELRTAKSILRKLYKKNVQLSSDIKKLRAARRQGLAAEDDHHAATANDALAFDENEARMLEARGADEDEDDASRADEQEDDGGEDGSVSPKRHPQKEKLALGGSSHLLFLLGERDTTINKLQAQVQSLNRRVNSMASRLEVSNGGGPSGPSSEGMFTDAGMESAHAQLTTLRTTFAEKLRAQMVQLQSMGEAPPSRRVAAYIGDLERWLIWEASWRQVEKTALNSQCMAAEKQAQESWVRSRLLEHELHELQQRFNSLDAKNRVIDTQLAAALEARPKK